MRSFTVLLTSALLAAFAASPALAATKHKQKAKAPVAQTQTTTKPTTANGAKDPDPRIRCELNRDPASCR